MNRSLRALVVAGVLAVTGAAQAMPVQWQFSGTLTDVASPSYNPFPPEVVIGESFTVLIQFDTNAALASKVADPDGDGHLYRFFNDSVRMWVSIGSVGPFEIINNDPSNRIIVRDNVTVGGQQVDGISFGITDFSASPTDNFGLILRGPLLSLLSLDPLNPVLPAAPPAGLADLAISGFQLCRYFGTTLDGTCPEGSFFGEITSVTAVPEPSTVALMLLGLAAMGAGLRRRDRQLT